MSDEVGDGPPPGMTGAEMTLTALHQRHDEVLRLEALQSEIVKDFEEAMNLVVAYQRCLKILRSPDPNFVQARRLLRKYKMQGVEPVEGYKVYADGVDITLHPDSILATAVEDDQIESGEALAEIPETVAGATITVQADEVEDLGDGQEIVELVLDNETGKMGFRPVERVQTPEADTFATTPDPDNVPGPETRDWLTEANDGDS